MNILSETIRELAENLKEISETMDNEISSEADDHIALVQKAARDSLEKVKLYRSELGKRIEEIIDESNSRYEEIKAFHKNLEEKLKVLGKIEIPQLYGLKDLIDIAYRFSHLTDEQWKRLVELAIALGPMENRK